MEWKFTGNLPVYQQIMDTIQGAVLRGEFRLGEKFPSVRELATAAMVNPNTVQRAMQELEHMGLLVTDGTNGRYVTDDPSMVDAVRKRCIRQITQECLDRFFVFGITPEEAIQMLTQEV